MQSNHHSQPLIRMRKVRNAIFVGFSWFAAALSILALSAILFTLVSKGAGGLNLKVFVDSTPAPGSEGGLANAIVGSIMLCVLGLAIAVVLGLLAGTWLAEYGRQSRLAHVVRFVNDVLLSAPSVLIGLFVYGILVAPFHTFSGFAGAAALALIALPIVTRTTEDVLRLQPRTLRDGGLALGAPLGLTIWSILWQAASGGIITGALLAFARISGETAPLLFTALNNQFFSLDMTQPMANLPVVIYRYALSAYEDWNRLAWAGALLIAIAVLGASALARSISRRIQGK